MTIRHSHYKNENGKVKSYWMLLTKLMETSKKDSIASNKN